MIINHNTVLQNILIYSHSNLHSSCCIPETKYENLSTTSKVHIYDFQGVE